MGRHASRNHQRHPCSVSALFATGVGRRRPNVVGWSRCRPTLLGARSSCRVRRAIHRWSAGPVGCGDRQHDRCVGSTRSRRVALGAGRTRAAGDRRGATSDRCRPRCGARWGHVGARPVATRSRARTVSQPVRAVARTTRRTVERLHVSASSLAVATSRSVRQVAARVRGSLRTAVARSRRGGDPRH
jgi:hypothetical protein